LNVAGFVDIGGYAGLIEQYMNSTPTFRKPDHLECGIPRNDSFNVFRDVHSDFPWTGVIFGMPVLSIWYWCTDQVTYFFGIRLEFKKNIFEECSE